MSVAYIADLHARGKDIDAFLAQLSEALGACRERSVTDVVFLGDTFDRANVHDKHASVGRVVRGMTDLICASPFHFHVIDGNHDRPNNEAASANQVLSACENVTVYDTPASVEIGGTLHHMVPWMYGQKPVAILDSMVPHRGAVLCAHLQVLGAHFAPGIVAKEGTFAIEKDLLVDMPFERFCLGDFHVRQEVEEGRGGYVGGFRELNFSEEGIGGHFEIWDNGEVEVIELTAAPVHKTLLWEEGDPCPDVPEGDYVVRVQTHGWVPAEYPEGLRVDPVIEGPTAASRIEEMAEVVTPAEALAMWLSTKDDIGADEQDLRDRLEAISSDLPEHVTPRAVRFERSVITNFGPHEHREVDWQDYGSLVGIIGQNGAGKTFVMEADFACLTGELPSYGGGLYEAVRQGQDKAELTTTFWVGDSRYRLEREINAKARTQKARLFDGDKEVAGPKVGDVRNAVEALIGPPRVALATWFSAQGGRGDICMMPRSEVREVLADMKNLAAYEAVSKEARALASRFGHTASMADAKAKDLEGVDVELSETRDALKDKEQALATARTLETTEEERIADFRERIKGAEGAVERNAQAMLAAERKRSLAQDLERLEQAAVRNEGLLTEIGQLSSHSGKAEGLRSAIRRHEEAYAQREKAREAGARRTALASQLEGLSVPEEGDTDKYRAKLSTFGKALADLRAEERRLFSSISKLEGEIGYSKSIEAPSGHIGDVACQGCSLFQASLRARAGREECERKLVLERASLEKIRGRISTGEGMVEDYEARLAEEAEKTRIAQEAQREKARIEAEIAAIPEVSFDEGALQDDIEAVRASLQETISAGARLAALREQLVDGVDEKVSATRQAIQDLIVPDIDEEAQERLTHARQGLEKAQDFHRELLKSMSTLSAEVQSLSAKAEDLRVKNDLRMGSIEEARISYAEEKLHLLLAEAFSKTGAPALILDHATRALEVGASRMLSEATDGAMMLTISTTGETQDGRTVEDFSIRIRDRHGERDVSRISGGESRLVRIILRQALMSWLSTSGGDIRVDEAFDALDDDRAAGLIDALGKISGRGQIVLVTHNSEHAARLPRVMEL